MTIEAIRVVKRMGGASFSREFDHAEIPTCRDVTFLESPIRIASCNSISESLHLCFKK